MLVGVREEDDPKNHNKEFVDRKMGVYSDESGEKVFAGIAAKYGGRFLLALIGVMRLLGIRMIKSRWFQVLRLLVRKEPRLLIGISKPKL